MSMNESMTTDDMAATHMATPQHQPLQGAGQHWRQIMLPSETVYGYIHTVEDALRLVEACRQGVLRRVTKRFSERERRAIRSGSVFIFNEEESGIRRWTDGRLWSPSRIAGNFLVYRELDRSVTPSQKAAKTKISENNMERRFRANSPASHGNAVSSRSTSPAVVDGPSIIKDNHDMFRSNGLIKKTITVTLDAVSYSIISYYALSEVEGGHLASISTYPELAPVVVTETMMAQQTFRRSASRAGGRSTSPKKRKQALDGSLSKRTASRPSRASKIRAMHKVYLDHEDLDQEAEEIHGDVAKGHRGDLHHDRSTSFSMPQPLRSAPSWLTHESYGQQHRSNAGIQRANSSPPRRNFLSISTLAAAAAVQDHYDQQNNATSVHAPAPMTKRHSVLDLLNSPTTTDVPFFTSPSAPPAMSASDNGFQLFTYFLAHIESSSSNGSDEDVDMDMTSGTSIAHLTPIRPKPSMTPSEAVAPSISRVGSPADYTQMPVTIAPVKSRLASFEAMETELM